MWFHGVRSLITSSLWMSSPSLNLVNSFKKLCLSYKRRPNIQRFSILKPQPREWGERDVCQEYITPDCLKHAGVPEMPTKKWFCLLQGRKISHSIPQEDSESSLVVWIIYQRLPKPDNDTFVVCSKEWGSCSTTTKLVPQNKTIVFTLELAFSENCRCIKALIEPKNTEKTFVKNK